jgi:cell division protein FtsB
MLRYLYTLDCAQIYRASDPLFSDVERDLDVFAIADKYGLDELRDYMTAQLRRFYETDQRPPGDPKEWSAKNQEGFGRVLRKVHAMEMEAAGAIRRAIAGFVVRREKMVRKWGVVEEVMSEGVWLGNEMLLAVLAHNKQLTETVGLLEAEVQELKAEMEVMETEREDLEGEVEYLSELQAGDDLVDRVEMYEEYCNDMCQDSYYYSDYADYHVEWMLMAEEMDSKGETVHVEDLLSGVSFAFGAEGPMDPDDVEEWWVD